MRRVLTIFVFVVGIIIVFFSITNPVFAQFESEGCCYIPDKDGNSTCTNSAALFDPNNPNTTKRRLCTEKGGTSYVDVCHCSGTISPPSTYGALPNLDQCCVWGPYDCGFPVNGLCADQPVTDGPPRKAQLVSSACNTQPICNGTAPQITASPTTTPTIFKPQIPLPGSELFNGQEIIITGSTLGEYIAALYVFVVSAIGILAAVLVFYGGLKWLTAGGDRGRIQDAKEQISAAIIGILLVFAAYLLLLVISPKLVRFASLELKPIPKRIAAYEKDIAFDARGGGLGSVPIGDLNNWLNDPKIGMKVQYRSLITSLATSQVPVDLIYAIIFVESGGRPSLRSSAGACGIMQLLPGTAKKTCDELMDPKTNIEAGVRYLKQLSRDPCPKTAIRRDQSVAQCGPPDVQASGCSDGDLYYVIAAYNGGQGANCGSVDCLGSTWWLCDKNTGYQETRDYVLKVQAARDAMKPYLP